MCVNIKSYVVSKLIVNYFRYSMHEISAVNFFVAKVRFYIEDDDYFIYFKYDTIKVIITIYLYVILTNRQDL